MDDLEVVRRINELADEEHRLERAHAGTPLGEDELQRHCCVSAKRTRLDPLDQADVVREPTNTSCFRQSKSPIPMRATVQTMADGLNATVPLHPDLIEGLQPLTACAYLQPYGCR